MSVRPHRTNRLTQEEFSLNLLLEEFPKVFSENTISLKRYKHNYNICSELYIFIKIFHRILFRMRNILQEPNKENLYKNFILKSFHKLVPL